MTIEQSLSASALDGADALSWTGWLHADEVDEALGTEFDDPEEADPRPFMPPLAGPVWPRVYPGL